MTIRSLAYLKSQFATNMMPTGETYAELIEATYNGNMADILRNYMIESARIIHLADYVTDPSKAAAGIQRILDEHPEGHFIIMGDLLTEYTVDNEVHISNLAHVTFQNISFTGYIFRTFFVEDNSKFITFRGCNFRNIQRVINIYVAQDVTVEFCNFDWCGYCVLGMFHYEHHNVRALFNNIYNARADFVEMNSDTTLGTSVIVMGNIFHGSVAEVIHPTHLYREQRFVGITGVKNVIVSNNIVYRCWASAIHVEVEGGQCVIANNTFEGCVVRRKTASGNRLGGVIEVSGNCKDLLIVGNYLVKDEEWIDSDGTRDDSCFIFLNYYQSTRPIVISTNTFDSRGLPSWTMGTSKQSGFGKSRGGILFTTNKLINETGFDISDTYRMSINDNQFDGPIISNLRAPTNVQFNNNTVYVKDEIQYAVQFREMSPSQPLNVKNLIMTGNFFNKPLQMRYPMNVIFSNNMMPEAAALPEAANNVDRMINLYGTNLTAANCNIKASNNLLAIDADDNWSWLDPIPETPTGYDDFEGGIPLHG